MNQRRALFALCMVLAASGFAQQSGDLDERLASDFWSWRARYGQYTSDDVTRMERPLGAVRDWSATSVEKQRKELATFDSRWKRFNEPTAPIHQQVDHWLIGSALAPETTIAAAEWQVSAERAAASLEAYRARLQNA